MLKVTLPATEYYDEVNNLFIDVKEQRIALEHSLLSLSKWEQKWKKPFLKKDNKTREETLDYVRCMTITQNVPKEAYLSIPQNVLNQITEYIEDDMTATTFSSQRGAPNREIITSELIYYWMIACQIPFECQKWHLNTLLTLIRVCNIKNTPPKKRSKRDIMARNRALNAARRQQLNTTG